MNVDVIYVTASAHDARFTRICIASIRYFYPDVTIRLLLGGALEGGLVQEMREFWNVDTANFEQGDYGWGFVKLEPLFGVSGERFLVLDSDTVLAGPVLDACRGSKATFLVDQEAQSEADINRLYYNWQAVREIDSEAQPPRFVFNSGQWFGTAGVLTRDDFAPWLEWTMPRRLKHPNLFMPGDQGILNYAINQKASFCGLAVETAKIMHWPGHGMSGFTADGIAGRTLPSVIIHWAGMKKGRQRDMVGSDLLGFFEEFYYSHLPGGKQRRRIAACRYAFSQMIHEVRMNIRLGVNGAGRRLKARECS